MSDLFNASRSEFNGAICWSGDEIDRAVKTVLTHEFSKRGWVWSAGIKDSITRHDRMCIPAYRSRDLNENHSSEEIRISGCSFDASVAGCGSLTAAYELNFDLPAIVIKPHDVPPVRSPNP